MKNITKITPGRAEPAVTKIRVAAYCRVSTDSDAQHESLEAQKLHYEKYIALHDDWELAGIYYDFGVTGTRMDCRDALQKLIADCKCGRVQLILTKSISRFSRNTTECLELVRELDAMHIPVIFEKEGINTGTMESEMLLGIMSSLAESESVSSSENIQWAIRHRFMNGTFKLHSAPYGYRWENDRLEIIPEEAEIVRFIFAEALAGKGTEAIAKELNRRKIPCRKGEKWAAVTIMGILKNERYIGNALLQKTYTDSRFRRHANHGERDQYLIMENHEPIIRTEDFEAVQKLIQQRAAEKGNHQGNRKSLARYAFSGKIICGECSDRFKRQIHKSDTSKYVAWVCSTHIREKSRCSMLFIRDDSLTAAFTTMMNKLIFSRKMILKPLLSALSETAEDASLKEIQELENRIAENTDRHNKLTKLMTQGVVDMVFFNQQAGAIQAETEQLRTQIRFLQCRDSADMLHLKALTELDKYTEKTEISRQFDEKAFTAFVDRVVIISRNTAVFELKCGLRLKEVLK